MTVDVLDRRSFLRVGTLGLAGAMRGRLRAQTLDKAILSPYVADVNGDGQLDAIDKQLMQYARFTSRGFSLEPSAGFDYRADVLARGEVNELSVDAVLRTIDSLGSGALVSDPRPITVAWHYGWHHRLTRAPPQQTVRYLDGDYLSNDPLVEETFNRLKNEFGITVDAVSWIPKRMDTSSLLSNYRAGYFKASNTATRHIALLYENTEALPGIGGRIDFRSPGIRNLLLSDFEGMARTLVEARDVYPTRVFLLSGRPVIFIFGSHTWGLTATDVIEFERMTSTIDDARQAFKAVYGSFPYLVGEELLQMASSEIPSADRVNRAINFDAIFSYHAANLKPTAPSFAVNPAYTDFQKVRLSQAATAIRGLRNRFTGSNLLLIPSLAGGFAKEGMPILRTSKDAYASFMKSLVRFYADEYLPQEWPGAVGSTSIPAPVYTVGSWNEEFEGHAVFPAQFNFAFADSRYSGFDFVLALKEVFGWNHYAERSIGESVR